MFDKKYSSLKKRHLQLREHLGIRTGVVKKIEKNSTNTVGIIIPAFNQLAYCKKCINSVIHNTKQSYKLILVNNGSTDGIAHYFDTIEDAEVIHSSKNLGFPAGVNLGIKRHLALGLGHCVLLNTDTVVTPGWLKRLTSYFPSDPKLGMIGPRTNCAGSKQQLHGIGELNKPKEINDFGKQLRLNHAGQLEDINVLIGFCVVIRKNVLREVGLLDERFGLGNCDDDDYCKRVKMAGYDLKMAKDVYVHHYGSKTFQAMKVDRGTLIKENRKKFQEKWKKGMKNEK